ncbi:hypothetical protein As57867_018876, partial [Aphanomyces stellatus]
MSSSDEDANASDGHSERHAPTSSSPAGANAATAPTGSRPLVEWMSTAERRRTERVPASKTDATWDHCHYLVHGPLPNSHGVKCSFVCKLCLDGGVDFPDTLLAMHLTNPAVGTGHLHAAHPGVLLHTMPPDAAVDHDLLVLGYTFLDADEYVTEVQQYAAEQGFVVSRDGRNFPKHAAHPIYGTNILLRGTLYCASGIADPNSQLSKKHRCVVFLSFHPPTTSSQDMSMADPIPLPPQLVRVLGHESDIDTQPSTERVGARAR